MIPKWPARLAALCTAIAVVVPASAQVQVNSSALQQLAGPKAKPATPHEHHAAGRTVRHERAESRRHEAGSHGPVRHEAARPKAARPNTAPHETARHETARHETARHETARAAHHAASRPLPLPPPVPMQLREAAARLPLPPPLAPRPAPPKPPPAPPPHLMIDFLGRAASLGDVERAEIERFLHALPTKTHRFLIRATAPGQKGNPSVARRLSLQRGLAVQSVLIAAGIPPERIIVQSLGDPPGADTRRVVLSELP